MKIKETIVIMLTLFLTVSCSNTNQMETLTAKIEQLESKNDSLERLAIKKQNYWYDIEIDGKELIEKDIKNPVEFIENTLRRNLELIPLKATLGGIMHYGNMQLLGREWLIAEFDDGHVYGKAIYQYTLNKKGKLDFKLLQYIKHG